jgi:hypothetical protein
MAPNMHAEAKGHAAVETARGAGAPGDTSFGKPVDDMDVAAQTALAEAEKHGPLFADRVKDARALMSDTLALEQVARDIRDGIERGAPMDAATRRRDDELTRRASAIRGRRTKLSAHVDGLPKVLEARAFPDPERDATSGEVKADIERKLKGKLDDPTALVPAVTDLGTQALRRGDRSMFAHLLGDYGQTLITNAFGDDTSDAKHAIGEVRGVLLDAAGEQTAGLSDTQRSALSQLQAMEDLRDAVTASMAVAQFRFEDAFDALPWASDFDRADAQADPARNAFFEDPLLR